jgi:hypothetical protein
MHENVRHLLIVTAICGSMLTAGAAVAGQRAEVKDLVGRDAIKAFDVMTSRGFASVDTYTTSDDYLVTWWYNAKTGQCVNTQSKDNKVTSAAEDRNPKCVEAAAKAGGSEANAGTSSSPSKQAKKACVGRFGGDPDIKSFTALKPGWWEIILLGHRGRKVACTANDDGTIDDWVEMK